jgi:hypothetical protein
LTTDEHAALVKKTHELTNRRTTMAEPNYSATLSMISQTLSQVAMQLGTLNQKLERIAAALEGRSAAPPLGRG